MLGKALGTCCQPEETTGSSSPTVSSLRTGQFDTADVGGSTSEEAQAQFLVWSLHDGACWVAGLGADLALESC